MFIIRSEQAQLRPPGACDAGGEAGGAGFVQPGGEKAAEGSDYSFPLAKMKRYRRQRDFSKRCTAKGQEATDASCNKGNSSWDINKTTFQWVVQSWDKAQSPSLEIFKTQLQKKPLSNAKVSPTLSTRLDYRLLEVPAQPKFFYDSIIFALTFEWPFSCPPYIHFSQGNQRVIIWLCKSQLRGPN